MNDLLFFSLLVLTLIRMLGFAVSFQFFFEMKQTKKNKQTKLGMITLGWLSWSISGILRILANLEENQLLSEYLFLLDYILLSLGSFYICVGVISYFRSIRKNNTIVLNIALVVIPIIFYILISLESSIVFTNICIIGSYTSVFAVGFIERKNLRSYIGNSIIWFYCTLIVVTIYLFDLIYLASKNALFNLYQLQEDILSVLVYYLFGIGITLIVFLLLMHLEHSLSTMDKNELKDLISHDIGNLIQIIYSNIEMHETSCEELVNVELIKQKCKDAGDLINEIRRL